MSVEEGKKAPDFTAATDGGKKLKLSDLRGKPVVLYFYPKDDTSGCTAEACGFRDSLPDFSKVKAQVIGVSKDSVEKHDKFKKKYGLTFPLVSDEDGKICEKYGTWVREEPLWPQVHGHRARHLPDRQDRHRGQGLAQGEGARPCRRGAAGREGALTFLSSRVK